MSGLQSRSGWKVTAAPRDPAWPARNSRTAARVHAHAAAQTHHPRGALLAVAPADFLESMDPSVRIKLRSMFDDGVVGSNAPQQQQQGSSAPAAPATACRLLRATDPSGAATNGPGRNRMTAPTVTSSSTAACRPRIHTCRARTCKSTLRCKCHCHAHACTCALPVDAVHPAAIRTCTCHAVSSSRVPAVLPPQPRPLPGCLRPAAAGWRPGRAQRGRPEDL